MKNKNYTPDPPTSIPINFHNSFFGLVGPTFDPTSVEGGKRKIHFQPNIKNITLGTIPIRTASKSEYERTKWRFLYETKIGPRMDVFIFITVCCIWVLIVWIVLWIVHLLSRSIPGSSCQIRHRNSDPALPSFSAA